MDPVTLAVLAGGGIYVGVQALDQTEEAAGSGESRASGRSSASTVPKYILDQVRAVTGTPATAGAGAVPKSKVNLQAAYQIRGSDKPQIPLFTTSTSAAQLQQRELLQQAEKRAREEYDKLTDEAKAQGAAIANEALGTDLTGDESWEEAGRIIGAAVGGAAAAYGCVQVGAGALAKYCATLGALIGAYLGGEVGAWLGEQWESVEEWASDLYDDAGDAVSDALDYLNPF